MMNISTIVCIFLGLFCFRETLAKGDGSGAVTKIGKLGDADDDSEKFERYKTLVCNLNPEFGGTATTGRPWMDELTEEEVLELAFVNMAYGLTSDSIAHLKDKLGWKKTVIDKISLITKATCRDSVVSEMYLNAAKNLFLYYLMKIDSSMNVTAKTGDEDEVRGKQWEEILKSLSRCSKAVDPIEITMDCGLATNFVDTDGVENPIDSSTERFDEELDEGSDVGLDFVIDTVWWMFSTTYARCYSYFYPNEDVILLFFQRFRDDFLDFVSTRWRSAGPLSIHFDLIFGPFDFETSAANTRSCCAAAYNYEGLTARQLVRPVTVLVDNVKVRNFKVD